MYYKDYKIEYNEIKRVIFVYWGSTFAHRFDYSFTSIESAIEFINKHEEVTNEIAITV